MKNLNDVHMTVNSGRIAVGWKDDAGNRHHVWLEVQQTPGTTLDSPNGGYQPLRPFRVKPEFDSKADAFSKPGILYRNPPLKADGSPRTRREEGYFETRQLDASAKGNAPLVAEALRLAEEGGMFELVVAANTAKKEEDKRQQRIARRKQIETIWRKSYGHPDHVELAGSEQDWLFYEALLRA